VVKIIPAANREKLDQRPLDLIGFIDCAALSHRDLALPMPGQREAGQRPRQHWFLQECLLPALAIDRDIDTPPLVGCF
jgi:hypothetical protein